MDGYSPAALTDNERDLIDRFLYLEELRQKQNEINTEIGELTEEMQSLPEMPMSLEHWANSFAPDFKMADYNRMFSIRKRFRKLMEDRQSNGTKIRLFAIDAVLDQIKEAIGDEQ